MDHFEMVEKLRQKANVSYEEARAALEASNWDILDALVLLESEGKVRTENGAEYTTQEKPKFTVEVEGSHVKDGAKRLGTLLKNLLQKGNANSFVILRKGEELLSMPVIVLAVLLFWLWPGSLIALVIGLFSGCRYSFRGPDVGNRINETMNKAADVAQGKNEKEDK